MRRIHETRDVDRTRLLEMRFERAQDAADVLRRWITLGLDERYTVLELAQPDSRRRIQQSVDSSPVLEEGLRPHHVRNGEAHLGDSRHQVLENRHGLRNSSGGHSRQTYQICRHWIQYVQSKGTFRLFQAFSDLPDVPGVPPDVYLRVADTRYLPYTLDDRNVIHEPPERRTADRNAATPARMPADPKPPRNARRVASRPLAGRRWSAIRLVRKIWDWRADKGRRLMDRLPSSRSS